MATGSIWKFRPLAKPEPFVHIAKIVKEKMKCVKERRDDAVPVLYQFRPVQTSSNEEEFTEYSQSPFKEKKKKRFVKVNKILKVNIKRLVVKRSLPSFLQFDEWHFHESLVSSFKEMHINQTSVCNIATSHH